MSADRLYGRPGAELFRTPRLTLRELGRADLPALQALFEADPAYFLTVNGQPPRPDEAEQEYDESPPAALSWTRRWFAGVYDSAQRLQGLLIVVSDLSAPAVWHTALFFLATPLHGSGAAHELQAALEAWAGAGGARWLRLGVVAGNSRAERFWARCGYREVRSREIVDASGQPRTVRVLVKPVGRDAPSLDGLADYLNRVPRDAPGADLP